jgi:hypothetical protein
LILGFKPDISNLEHAYDYYSRGGQIKPLSAADKKKMLHTIMAKTDFVNDSKFYRKLHDVLKALDIDNEFVIADVSGFLEVNAIIEHKENGKILEYEILYPPLEFETINPNDVMKQYKEGTLRWKQDRVGKSKVLQNIIQLSNMSDSDKNKLLGRNTDHGRNN